MVDQGSRAFPADKSPFFFSGAEAQVRLPVCVYCFNKFIHLKGRAGMRLVAGGYRTLGLLLSFDMKVIIFPLAGAGPQAVPPPPPATSFQPKGLLDITDFQ